MSDPYDRCSPVNQGGLMPLSTIFQLYCDKTRVPGENHWPAASHWQTLSHYVVSNTHAMAGNQTHNFSGDRLLLHR